MKAAVVYGENDIRIADVPTPSPGPGEALVKVKASGVGATDVKILGGTGLPGDLPAILGHEVAGTVEALGGGVTGLKADQRVAVYPIAVCGACFFCERGRHSLCVDQYGLAHGVDGGFAEYVLVPDRIVRLNGVVDIGDMPFDLAAMIEPVSCCLSAAALLCALLSTGAAAMPVTPGFHKQTRPSVALSRRERGFPREGSG